MTQTPGSCEVQKMNESLQKLRQCKEMDEQWRAVTDEQTGRIVYVNDGSGELQWMPPPQLWKQDDTTFARLPYGWEPATDMTGRPYYISHLEKTTTYEDPRTDGKDENARDPQPRQVTLHKDPDAGFGFVAGSEKPVIVRCVSEGGPSVGKLLPEDQILRINDVNVKDVPREQVINMVLSSGQTLNLTVCQPSLADKSNLLTAAKRWKKTTDPSRSVRFAGVVAVNGSPLIHDPSDYDSCIPFMPNVLKVFLENGQTKSFKYDKRTTVQNVLKSLQEKLSIKCMDYFSLVLQQKRLSNQRTRNTILPLSETLCDISSRPGAEHFKVLLRVTFVPKDAYDLLNNDPVAFEYFYKQCCDDVIGDAFFPLLQPQTAMKLAALQIQEEAALSNISGRPSLKEFEQENGLQKYIPSSFFHTMKKKDTRKGINHYLKINQNMAVPGQKSLTTLQAKLHYLKVLSELPSFGMKYYNLVQKGLHTEIIISLGPKFGICQVSHAKNYVPTMMIHYEHMAAASFYKHGEFIHCVEIRCHDASKNVAFLLSEEEGADLVATVQGYYRLTTGQNLPVYDGRTSRVYETKEEFMLNNYKAIQALEAPPYYGHHRVLKLGWNYAVPCSGEETLACVEMDVDLTKDPADLMDRNNVSTPDILKFTIGTPNLNGYIENHTADAKEQIANAPKKNNLQQSFDGHSNNNNNNWSELSESDSDSLGASTATTSSSNSPVYQHRSQKEPSMMSTQKNSLLEQNELVRSFMLSEVDARRLSVTMDIDISDIPAAMLHPETDLTDLTPHQGGTTVDNINSNILPDLCQPPDEFMDNGQSLLAEIQEALNTTGPAELEDDLNSEDMQHLLNVSLVDDIDEFIASMTVPPPPTNQRNSPSSSMMDISQLPPPVIPYNSDLEQELAISNETVTQNSPNDTKVCVEQTSSGIVVSVHKNTDTPKKIPSPNNSSDKAEKCTVKRQSSIPMLTRTTASSTPQQTSTQQHSTADTLTTTTKISENVSESIRKLSLKKSEKAPDRYLSKSDGSRCAQSQTQSTATQIKCFLPENNPVRPPRKTNLTKLATTKPIALAKPIPRIQQRDEEIKKTNTGLVSLASKERNMATQNQKNNNLYERKISPVRRQLSYDGDATHNTLQMKETQEVNNTVKEQVTKDRITFTAQRKLSGDRLGLRLDQHSQRQATARHTVEHQQHSPDNSLRSSPLPTSLPGSTVQTKSTSIATRFGFRREIKPVDNAKSPVHEDSCNNPKPTKNSDNNGSLMPRRFLSTEHLLNDKPVAMKARQRSNSVDDSLDGNIPLSNTFSKPTYERPNRRMQYVSPYNMQRPQSKTSSGQTIQQSPILGRTVTPVLESSKNNGKYYTIGHSHLRSPKTFLTNTESNNFCHDRPQPLSPHHHRASSNIEDTRPLDLGETSPTTRLPRMRVRQVKLRSQQGKANTVAARPSRSRSETRVPQKESHESKKEIILDKEPQRLRHSSDPDTVHRLNIVNKSSGQTYTGPHAFDIAYHDIDILIKEHLDKNLTLLRNIPSHIILPDEDVYREQLLSSSKKFVIDSKLLVSFAAKSGENVIQQLNVCMEHLTQMLYTCGILIPTLSFDDMALELGEQMRDVAQTFRTALPSIKVATESAEMHRVTEQSRKADIQMLLQQAANLAASLGALMRTLRFIEGDLVLTKRI